MRVFVFANDESRASIHGLKGHQIHTQDPIQIFYWKFSMSEGLILEEGDWIQVIQQFGESEAGRCVSTLVKSALANGFFLKVMDINVFEVVDPRSY